MRCTNIADTCHWVSSRDTGGNDFDLTITVEETFRCTASSSVKSQWKQIGHDVIHDIERLGEGMGKRWCQQCRECGEGGVRSAESVGKMVSEVQRVGQGVVSSAEGGVRSAGRLMHEQVWKRSSVGGEVQVQACWKGGKVAWMWTHGKKLVPSSYCRRFSSGCRVLIAIASSTCKSFPPVSLLLTQLMMRVISARSFGPLTMIHLSLTWETSGEVKQTFQSILSTVEYVPFCGIQTFIQNSSIFSGLFTVLNSSTRGSNLDRAVIHSKDSSFDINLRNQRKSISKRTLLCEYQHSTKVDGTCEIW